MSKTFPYTYIRKKIVKTSQALIPIQAKVVQYGLGCFSGIRANYDPKNKNLFIFRLDEHYKRLKNSSKILGMKFELTSRKFANLIINLAQKNKIREDCYIRPTIYSASTLLTPRFDSGDDDLAIYMISLKNYFAKEGLDVCVSTWRRIDDDALSIKAKVTGSYANAALAKTEAIKSGYDEGIFLNRDGKVCEAGSSNIFLIIDGEVYSPPLGSNNLNGITRNSLIELFRHKMGISVREESVDRSMLYMADELFLCGTAAKVAWIRSVDKRVVGNGKIGRITSQISNIYEQILRCHDQKYQKWCTPVY